MALITIVGTFEFAVESSLGPHGTFWVYSGIMFVAFIWSMFAVKETRGKTNYQKKTLYTPKSLVQVQGVESGGLN